MKKVDLPALRSALLDRSVELCSRILGEPNRSLSSKHELRFGRKGSLAVTLSGDHAGLWFDHENCEGGDLLALIMRHYGVSFPEARKLAADLTGVDFSLHPLHEPIKHPHRSSSQSDAVRHSKTALDIWTASSKNIAKTPVACYLNRRALQLPPGAAGNVIRFHSQCLFQNNGRHPAMIALLRDITTDEPRAIHRTALTVDGEKAPFKPNRLMLGSKIGAAIKLSPDEEITNALAIGEGIETTISGMMFGFSPAWAVGDAGELGQFPVLPGIETLTIFVDNDGAGKKSAFQCSDRWTKAGREVFRVVPNKTGDDLNDILKCKVTA